MTYKSRRVTTTLTRTASACGLQNMGEGSMLPNLRCVCSLHVGNTIVRYDFVHACYTFVMSERQRKHGWGKKCVENFEDFVVLPLKTPL
jgi:hypothetical protein